MADVRSRNLTIKSEARRAVEAILFLTDEPLAAGVLAQAVEMGRRDVERLLRALAHDYEDASESDVHA